MRRSLLCAALLLPCAPLLAGTLDPPGPPAPTMKPLDQVEPRTPISSLPYVIDTPGSYYLTRNLKATGLYDGISIHADNVTIDLYGFTLDGGNSGTLGQAGIVANQPSHFTVTNGRIVNWVGGIYADINAAGSAEVRNVTITGCSQYAAYLPNGTIENSAFLSNADGVHTASATVRKSRFSQNQLRGLNAGPYSLIEDCVAESNGLDGMVGGALTIVRHTWARSNAQYGISVGSNSTVFENNVHGNGYGGIEAGGSSRIEANHVISNAVEGIVAYGGCVVIRNTAKGNGSLNYDVSSPAVFQVDTTGTSTNPWVNFSF